MVFRTTKISVVFTQQKVVFKYYSWQCIYAQFAVLYLWGSFMFRWHETTQWLYRHFVFF